MCEKIPGKMYHSVGQMVKDVFGSEISVLERQRVAGGDINDAYRVTLSDGRSVFVKENSIRNMDFFLTEAEGLNALASAGKTGVPKILGMGKDEQRGTAFLSLEYIESGPRTGAYWEIFGRQMAGLHRAACGISEDCGNHTAKYGFKSDNYIGASPQKNHPKQSWIDFYRECRLMPQLEKAERYFEPAVRKKADHLLEHLESYLREPDFPSLLHGDLWSGNMMCGADGKAWIIDPAAYVGDFETDLAMTQLFGSLPERFYEAYNEVNPVDKAGFRERKPLYDLYHLLNHLNLFGSAYLRSVREIIGRF